MTINGKVWLSSVAVAICLVSALMGIIPDTLELGAGDSGTQITCYNCVTTGHPQSYTKHAPIAISNDTQFTPANGVSAGTGTPADPYIIEGYEIDAEGGFYAIRIMGTTAHFIIRDCKLWNATNSTGCSGVTLNNVRNAALHNVNASSNNFATDISSSENIAVENCTFFGNMQGLISAYSENLTIKNNRMWDNLYYGMDNDHCKNSTIYNNTVYGNGMFGIYLFSSEIGYLLNNTVENNNQTGINFYDTSNCTITGNLIRNQVGYGINLSPGAGKCVNNRIHHNLIIGNRGSGAMRDPAHVQAFDMGGPNWWNDSSEGNYWSDWTTPDTSPKDGIVDSPYIIDGGLMNDSFPLANPPYEVISEQTIFLIPFVAMVILSVVVLVRRKNEE